MASKALHLGDGCAAETSIATEVEVSTVAGAVDCGEARRVLDIYYSTAPTNGIGSGGRLEIAGWTCITAPQPEAPLAGHCSRAEGSEFEMYGVGYAFRPNVENADCHLPPPKGAGQYNLRASDIDCDAAHIVLSEWEASCSGSYGSDGPCHLNQGVSCRVIVKGIELAEVQCRGREDQLVTFETGA